MKYLHFLLTMLLCVGCTGHTQQYTITKATEQELSVNDVIPHINRNLLDIQTLKASGNIHLIDQHSTLSYPIILFYHYPKSLYIKAHKPLRPTIFELKTVNDSFWLYIPQDKIIYTGKNEILKNDPLYEVSLPPDVLVHALCPPYIETHNANVHESDTHFFVSTFHSLDNARVVHRQLTATKKSAHILFEKIYNPKGLLVYEIRRNDFIDTSHKTAFPRMIFIKNILKGGAIRIDIEQVFINEELEEDIFDFLYPNKIDVERIY